MKADPQRNVGVKIDQTTRIGEAATKPGINTVPNTEQAKSLLEKESRTEMDRASSGAERIALYVCNVAYSAPPVI